MNTNYNPIGIFDSGFGGLTILNEIAKTLPDYDYLYLGDNARTPYGTRSFQIVYEYTLEAVKWFFNKGCHLVILACNTASAKALRTIQQNDLPKLAPYKRVLGVIRPSVEAINNNTKTSKIGVLATSGTVISESYPIEIKKLFPQIKTYQEACPMWVPLVENNEHNNQGADYFVKKNINNILNTDNEIDTLILGCTHYPLLIDKIKKYTPKNIHIISQGSIVAESLKDYLFRHPEIETYCSKNSNTEYYTTDSVEIFEKRASIFIGKNMKAKRTTL